MSNLKCGVNDATEVEQHPPSLTAIFVYTVRVAGAV